MTRIYLAGPDVFRLDAKELCKELKEKCKIYGFNGIFPIDETNVLKSPEQIFKHNVRLIDISSAVIANITSFRGPNADPGTAWEIGYAYARHKPVFAYSQDSSFYVDRVPHTSENDRKLDQDHLIVEDFDLADNLMLCCSVQGVWSSFDGALAATSIFLRQEALDE